MKKIVIIVAAVIVAAMLALLILHMNGLSGFHHHTEPNADQIKVACIGDSITYGHGIGNWTQNNYPAQLGDLLGEGYHVENFGHSGRTVSDQGDKPYSESKQYKLSIDYDADIIIFMLGTNDTKPENWTSIDNFMADYEKMVNRYKESNPDARIILCTPARAFFDGGKKSGTTNFNIQPNMIEQITIRVRTFALVNKYECIDIYDLTAGHSEWFKKDNVHPDVNGAKAIAKAVYDKITK